MIDNSYSLKKRLLRWISLSVLIASSLIVMMAYFFARNEIAEVYDSQLVHTAKTLLQITENEIIEQEKINISLGAENPKLEHKYENKTAFRIWWKDKIAIQSRSAERFSEVQAPEGFSSQRVNGKTWRFFVFVDDGKHLRVETSERYSIRNELIGQIMVSLAIPMAILIPSLLFIVWWSVTKLFEPVRAISNALDLRGPDDTSKLTIRGVPKEILPLLNAMNRLFDRVGDSFRREREFTDHAAHELRTPLAAMKTQTQVLMRKLAAMPEQREGLLNLNDTIDRAGHLVEQLLSLARLQNQSPPMEEIDLSDCVAEAASRSLLLAKQKEQNVTLSIAPSVHIRAHRDSVAILVRNLVDNAIKYTPEKGQIALTLSEDARLSIRDSGPGIPDPDKSRIFERFVRIDKTGQDGSGLGLAIVRWIAEAHQAKIILKDNQPKGLIVDVEFRA